MILFFNMIMEDILSIAFALFFFCFTPAIYFFFEFKKDKKQKHYGKAASKTKQEIIEVKSTRTGSSNEFADTGK